MVHTVAQEVRVNQDRVGRRQCSVMMEEHGARDLWYLANQLVLALLCLCLLRLLLEDILLQASIALAYDPFHRGELPRLLLDTHLRICLVVRSCVWPLSARKENTCLSGSRSTACVW